MKWDGIFLSEVVKEGLYSLFEFDIKNACQMDNKEYAAMLKKKHNYSGKSFNKCFISTRPNGITIRFLKPIPKELDGENTIEISWSMAARHIRAWEFEKQQEKAYKKPVQQQWDDTHLCGNYHGEHCEYLIEAKSDTVLDGKKLDSWCPYCTSENKVRKIGSAGMWTGLSPKFCPKRKALGNKEDNMARKLQFDAAITADMQHASDDSFADNIKMIDISQITPSMENFYEMGNLELLADDIEREGLKHNLVVSKNAEGGGYLLKSGHRRLAAIKLLIDSGRRKSSKVPCYVDGEKTAAEAKLDLIMLNATSRKYTDAEMVREYDELRKIFAELEAAGKPIKGKLRENIAAVLNVSAAQVGKLDYIRNNAVPEVEQAIKDGNMSISTANELAKLPEKKQRDIIESKPQITAGEIKEMQEKKPTKLKKGATNSTELEDIPDEYSKNDGATNSIELDEILDVYSENDGATNSTELEDIPDEYSKNSGATNSTENSGKHTAQPVPDKNCYLSLTSKEARDLLEFITNNLIDDEDSKRLSGILDKLKLAL